MLLGCSVELFCIIEGFSSPALEKGLLGLGRKLEIAQSRDTVPHYRVVVIKTKRVMRLTSSVLDS